MLLESARLPFGPRKGTICLERTVHLAAFSDNNETLNAKQEALPSKVYNRLSFKENLSNVKERTTDLVLEQNFKEVLKVQVSSEKCNRS